MLYISGAFRLASSGMPMGGANQTDSSSGQSAFTTNRSSKSLYMTGQSAHVNGPSGQSLHMTGQSTHVNEPSG